MKTQLTLLLTLLLSPLPALRAAEPFPGSPTNQHGVALFTVPIGKAKALVLVPDKPATGRPWVLAPSLYKLDSLPVANMTRTQLELVKAGFHVVALAPGVILGAPDPEKRWDVAYREMTERYGLSREVVLMGLSREGLPALRWAAENPGKVSCLYLDKAVCDFKSWPGGKLGKGKGSPKDWQQLLKVYGFASEAEALAYKGNPVDLTEKLAAARVGIIYVTGAEDDVVPFSENGAVLQKFYESKGLFFRLLLKPKEGHHPHGLADPAEIVRLIRMNTYAVPPTWRTVAYGPHYSQMLDFWKADSPTPTPAVVYLHGGGWNTGTRRDVGYLEDYLKAGISVVAVDYRFIAQAKAEGIAPPVRGPMEDVARALQFVRSKAAEWGLRKDRIGLTGGSAGACSSLWLAFHKDMADPASADPVARESTRPYCAAVQVPQTTLDPRQMKDWTPNSRYGDHAFGVQGGFAAFLEKRESLLPWIAEYSPYALASTGAPPVYLYFDSEPNMGHEQKDPTHTANFGAKLQERLRELNVPCELVYPGAPEVKHERVRDYLIDKLTERPPMEPIIVPIAAGPCEPNWKSLGDQFKCPTWWRQAKIGVWLHWGPQCVGEDGDWYAKWIYMPTGRFWNAYARVYSNHVARFGHPSESGYKDALLHWKAEKWDPDQLMALYKRAGARYVIGQGMHHDNFDLWDSKYQPWNAVKLGPQRDILGGWKKAADKQGLRFGIAFHGDYSLWWFQPAFLCDVSGPMKGVPYDGAQNYDGKETWWKKLGLDLKDLYGIDLKDDVEYPANFSGDPVEFRMRNAGQHGIPDGNLKKHIEFARWFATKWTRRVVDAIDQLSPDFIYFDGGGSYPFCGYRTGRGLRADATPRVIAHLYNSNMKKNGGKLEAMAFTKGSDDARAVAVNFESCFPKDIKRDQPWQTEVGLGEWFYYKGTFYESGMVIHQMLEAVARDGNYAINIPLTPSGELDPGGLQTLHDMGDWMDVNAEGIHDSSAWDVWGEGSVIMKRGNLDAEHAQTPYTGADIRFTHRRSSGQAAKNDAVYAWLMAWPEHGTATIHALATGAGKVTNVTLLGCREKLDWQQTDEGLIVHLPTAKPCQFAFGLKVMGENLKAASPAKRKP